MKEQGSGFKSRIVVYNPENTEKLMNLEQEQKGSEQATWMQVLLTLLKETRRRQEHGTS